LQKKSTRVRDFSDDELNRLVDAVNVNQRTGAVDEPFTWHLDEFGNVDYRSDVGTIVTEPNGRMVSVAGEPAEYDGNGNLVALGAELEMDWWASGQPALVQDTDATILLDYGPRDELVRRRHDQDGDSFRVGAHYEVFAPPSGSGKPTEMVSYVRAYGRPVAARELWRGPSGSGTAVLYPHADAHGSVNVATQANATTSPDVQRSYGPWGGVRPLNWLDPAAEPELSKVNIGYTGHRAKSNGPLIDMDGRQYHPGLGRFPSADPMTKGVFDTQAWNRFSYVRNNPTTFVDPSGFVLCDIGYVCGSTPMELGGSLLVATIINVARAIRRATSIRGANAPGAPAATAVQTEQRKNAFLFRDTPGAWSVGDYQQVSNGFQPYQQNLVKPGIGSILQDAYTDVLTYELPSARELALGYVDFQVSHYSFFAGKVHERLQQAAWIADNWHLIPETYVQGIANDVHNIFEQIPALGSSIKNHQWGDALDQYMSAGESVWDLAPNAAIAGGVRQAVARGAARGRPPNPFGRRGSPAHQARIGQAEERLNARGFETASGGSLPERAVNVGGGRLRFPDLVVRNAEGKTVAVQVGRATRSGRPVARERRALEDLRNSGENSIMCSF
jgi:RHS repeat-associated protein